MSCVLRSLRWPKSGGSVGKVLDKLRSNNAKNSSKLDQSVRDRGLARQFARGARLVDVDPLFVPGRVGECVDAVLGKFNPVADADLGADAALSSSKSLNTRIGGFFQVRLYGGGGDGSNRQFRHPVSDFVESH